MRIRIDNYTQTDLSTLIVGRKYWVNNGHWEFKVQSHSEASVRVYIYGLSKSVEIPYTHFLDVQLFDESSR